jgi:tRNA threonylcarbamoyladenosine biosynthesis protein TsaE
MIWQIHSLSSGDTERLGGIIGSKLKGGEVIELQADLGGGKTTLTRGIAAGLGIKSNITSPTFTLNRNYKTKSNLELRHFDFYRLADPGLMSEQLKESVEDHEVITVVEWAKVVGNILPQNRLTIVFEGVAGEENTRRIIVGYNESLAGLMREVENEWTSSHP